MEALFALPKHKTKKVLFIDQMHPFLQEQLTKWGFVCDLQYKASKEEIAAIIHDLKNPLHQIKGLTHLLKVDGLDKHETVEFLETIFNYSSDLVHNLLEIFEIEGENFQLNREPINLTELMKTIVQTNRLAAKEKNIRIETAYYADPCNIVVDRIKLTRAINNLISNAIKFSHAGTKIVVSLAPINGFIEVTIKDSGIGIDSTAQKFIFDRFSKYRRKGTKGEKTTGMGLFITKKIVEAHKGEIFCESEAGIGTTFTIKLKRIIQ
mgnify:CR=1 FL=1